MSTYIFPDTNIHLHFAPLDELDLVALVGDPDVTVVITRAVLRELDEKKNTHSSTRIRDRARRTLREIETALADGTPLKGKICVELFDTYPAELIEEHHLNPSWADDILLASVAAHQREHPDTTDVLLTDDTGLRLKCRSMGISVLEPPADKRLKSDISPELKELQELRLKVARSQAQSPDLVAVFDPTTDPKQVHHLSVIEPQAINREALQMAVEKVIQANPKHEIPQDTFGLWKGAFDGDGISHVSHGQWIAYNKQLDEFYDSISRYVEDRLEFKARKERSFLVSVQVQNQGSTPAEDVDISLRVPKGIEVYLEDCYPDAPGRPLPPSKPRSRIQELASLDSQIHIPRFSSALLSGIQKSVELEIRAEDDCSEIRWTFRRIKHRQASKMPQFWIVFPHYADADSFEIDYSILAANAPEPFSGSLHVVIEKIPLKEIRIP